MVCLGKFPWIYYGLMNFYLIHISSFDYISAIDDDNLVFVKSNAEKCEIDSDIQVSFLVSGLKIYVILDTEI